MMSLLLTVAISIAAPATQATDTWVYGEASNYCIAFFRQGPAQLVIRFSAKTADDTVQVWRPGLPSLTKGIEKRDQATAASRRYDLSLVLAGKTIPLTSQTGELKPKSVRGIAYMLGVDERSFIDALATGETLEVRHGGLPVATYRIAEYATLANRLAACTAPAR